MLPHVTFAQSNNAEWQQMKRDCGLDPGLPYNTWVSQGMPCNNGGGAQAQPSGPSPEEIRQNQLLAEARALDQKGILAFQNEDYDTAADYFEQALDKTPNDASIQQQLQNAKAKIEARNKFKAEQNEALNDLKGAAGDPEGGLKGGADTDTGLKDINPSEGPAVGASRSKHSATEINTDPNVVDLRGIENPTVDPARLKAKRAEEAQKLSGNPDYINAIDSGVAAYKTGDSRTETTAIEQALAIGDKTITRQDKDMGLLFDDPSQGKADQIYHGLALPTQDKKLNLILAEHPGLGPKMLALWRQAYTERMKGDDTVMAREVKKLSETQSRLGLPSGRAVETMKADPKTAAKWGEAVKKSALRFVIEEAKITQRADEKFMEDVEKLREGVKQP